MPKVSIIIPTYNVEQYLDECMQSIIRQTLEDIEIICVNDGSTDSSLEILQKYAEMDDRIVLISKENGGYGMAMNRGLDAATGEYIGILEPDDYVGLDMYEDLYKIAKENDLDFVKADFYRFMRSPVSKDMTLKYFALAENPDDYNQVFNPSKEPRRLDYIMNTWSGIYRKAFLDKNGIRHHETPGASFQDNGFFFQTFVYAERAMIVDRPYYRNRRDNPNSSVHNPGKVYCINEEYDYIREILMDDPALWERFKYMYWKKRFTNYLATMTRIGDEYKTEYAVFVSKELNRVAKAGLIRHNEYNDYHWGQMQFLLNDPTGFAYTRFSVAGTFAAASDIRVREIRESNTFKVGYAITYLPKKVKKLLKKIKRKMKRAK